MNDFNRRHDDYAPRARTIVMILVMLIPVAFVAGWTTTPDHAKGPTVRDIEGVPVPRELPAAVERFHDAAEGVTCWRTNVGYSTGEGISCLPDQWLLTAQADELP